jgi:hypothetical protein
MLSSSAGFGVMGCVIADLIRDRRLIWMVKRRRRSRPPARMVENIYSQGQSLSILAHFHPKMHKQQREIHTVVLALYTQAGLANDFSLVFARFPPISSRPKNIMALMTVGSTMLLFWVSELARLIGFG